MLSLCQTQKTLSPFLLFLSFVYAFQIIPTAQSYKRRLLVHVRSRREVCVGKGIGGGEGVHPGPPSPGKVTAWIIGTNQVAAWIERMLLSALQRNSADPQRQCPRPFPSFSRFCQSSLCDSRHLAAQSLFGQHAKMRRKLKIDGRRQRRGCQKRRGSEGDVSFFTRKMGCYEVHTTLFFFIIPLTAIALNYRGLFVKSEKKMNQKFI